MSGPGGMVTPAPATSRRNAELGLLAFAVGLAVAAYAAGALALTGGLPPQLVSFSATLGGGALVAHLAVRFLAPHADPVLLPAVTLLNGLGLAMIHRLDLGAAVRAAAAGDPAPAGQGGAQLIWTVVGIVTFVALLAVVRDHRVLARYTWTAMVVGLVLLVAPMIPGLGATINGARLWIRLGSLSFQPAEIAKIALMVFFAGYLVTHRDVLALAGRHVLGVDLPRARDLGPILVAWAASLVVLILQRDLGTSLLFFGVFVVVLFVATQRLSWALLGVVLFAGGAFVASRLFGHVANRVDAWLDPFGHVNDVGGSYQLVQGLYGMASGGMLGTGIGQGRPELVPLVSSDFIVAAIGEELGLAGLMAVLLVYAVVVERGLRTALAARDAFGKLLAVGLAFSLALQVFVVVGGVTRLLPLTGLTTPFLSYGGSSLLANWALVALLIRISDAARRPVVAPGIVTPSDATEVISR